MAGNVNPHRKHKVRDVPFEIHPVYLGSSGFSNKDSSQNRGPLWMNELERKSISVRHLDASVVRSPSVSASRALNDLQVGIRCI